MTWAMVLFTVTTVDIPLGAVPAGGDMSFLKPGDMVRIKIWRGGDLSGDYSVDEGGKLTLPLLGSVSVEEISTDSLKILLIKKYSKYLKDLNITVVPLFRINVMGEVDKPGLYPVDPTLSLSEVLSMAGGVDENGDIDKVKVIRGGEILSKNLKKELEGDQPIEKFGIKSGDQIVVGKKGGITVRDWTIIASMVSAAALVLSVIVR